MPALEIIVRIPTRPFRLRFGCFAFILAAILGIGPAPRAFASHQQEKPEKPGEQVEPNKQTKKERRAEAANRLPATLWRDPGDIASLDLLNGEGGAKDAPDPHVDYTFIKEDMNGTSSKFYALDSNGVRWLVKLGVEARPETAATRLVWATGYFTDEDYFLPQIHVQNLPKLRRKMFGASPKTGIVRNVRLKRQGEGLEKLENWDWFENPFVGTRELNGLRTLMALINDWDLTIANNKVYATDKERQFLVSDLGAAFGKTGWPPSHVPLLPHATKGVLKDYEHSRFIRVVTGDAVTFEMHTSAPSFIRRFRRKYFDQYRQIEGVAQGIPVRDAVWVGGLLARLKPQQIRDAFRAAGYQPAEVDGFAKVVEERIAALNQLKQ
jgi:hypothetical protein